MSSVLCRFSCESGVQGPDNVAPHWVTGLPAGFSSQISLACHLHWQTGNHGCMVATMALPMKGARSACELWQDCDWKLAWLWTQSWTRRTSSHFNQTWWGKKKSLFTLLSWGLFLIRNLGLLIQVFLVVYLLCGHRSNVSFFYFNQPKIWFNY